MGKYWFCWFFFVGQRVNTIVQNLLSNNKKRNRSELSVPNEKEINSVYEMMIIYVVKKSGYSVEYVNRMPFYKFLDLFDTLKNIDKWVE